MRSAVQAALQVDVQAVAVVLESFFRNLTHARDVVDVNIAAGTALEDLREIGQEAGKSANGLLKPI